MIYLQALIRKIRDVILSLMAPKDIYVDFSRNVLHVARYYDGLVETITPVQQTPSTRLSGKLVQPPGFVEVDGLVFDLREDGLYRFYRLRAVSVQRIVCTGGVNSLLRMLGYLWIYGHKDDRYPGILLEKIITKRTIFASCGSLARQAHAVCKGLGIDSRVVTTMSTEPWNGQDEGHTFLEIKGPDGQWFCYDPSFHYRFCLDGKPVPLLELSKHRASVQYQKLPGNSGRGECVIKNYDYGFWVEDRLLSFENLRNWYLQKLEVPLILSGRHYFFPQSFVRENDLPRFTFRYLPLSDEAFREKFYPDQKEFM